MRRIISLCCKGLALCCIFLSSAALAQDFKVNRYFVIGDTLNDSGSGSQAMWAIGKPNDIYYRVTENKDDGSSRTWAGFFANQLGVELKPYKLNGVRVIRVGEDADGKGIYVAADPTLHSDKYTGGTNYAQMGSRVSQKSSSFLAYDEDARKGVLVDIDGQLVPVDAKYAGYAAMSALDQIDELKRNVNTFHKNDLISIWTGSNDAIGYGLLSRAGYISFDRARELMRLEAHKLAEGIQSLRDRGARNILVLTLPAPSLEYTTPQEAGLMALFRDYNNQLKSELAGKDGLVIQTQKLVDALRTRPQDFGVTLGVGCKVPAIACIDRVDPAAPDDMIAGGPYSRSDADHPSQLQHLLYAQLTYATVKAASQNAGMTTSSLSTIRQAGLDLEKRLLPNSFYYINKSGKLTKREVGNIQTFGSISGNYFEETQGLVSPGTKTRGASLKAGADIVLGKNAIVGISATYNRNDVDFGDNSGGFESRQIIGSLYANISVTNSIYVNAAVSAGHINLDDITRNFNLNISEESYSGDTTGNYTSARLGIGYNYKSGGWSLNPALAYTYEHLKVKGYTESYGVGSLVFGDNEYESSRLSASLTASYTPQNPKGWSPMLRVSVEHDFNEDDMKVNLGFDKDTMGALYLERPDGTYGTVSAGISRNIGEETSFGINATSIIGEEGITGISGGITIKSKF